MALVYLIKHASPQVQPEVPAEEWLLSADGVAEAKRLGVEAQGWDLRAVYCSSEPKARSTGLLIADELRLPLRVAEGFEEIRIGWIGNADAYGERIREVLEQPAVAQRGTERASDAAERFASAMQIVAQAELPAAVVAHGRVLTAYLTNLLQLEDPYAFWRAMPMGGWARLDLTGPRLISGFAVPSDG